MPQNGVMGRRATGHRPATGRSANFTGHTSVVGGRLVNGVGNSKRARKGELGAEEEEQRPEF